MTRGAILWCLLAAAYAVVVLYARLGGDRSWAWGGTTWLLVLAVPLAQLGVLSAVEGLERLVGRAKPDRAGRGEWLWGLAAPGAVGAVLVGLWTGGAWRSDQPIAVLVVAIASLALAVGELVRRTGSSPAGLWLSVAAIGAVCAAPILPSPPWPWVLSGAVAAVAAAGSRAPSRVVFLLLLPALVLLAPSFWRPEAVPAAGSALALGSALLALTRAGVETVLAPGRIAPSSDSQPRSAEE